MSPVVDTWWQTETGGIMIAPLPGVTTLKPGSATKPLPGIGAAVVDEAGNQVALGGGGYVTLTRPWPGMLRGIWGDDERYKETYWNRFGTQYFAGDGARIDEDGYFWFMGRVDDVMNVAGHRISTAEVESALVDHPAVAEAAVVAKSDPETGQAISAFVTAARRVRGIDRAHRRAAQPRRASSSARSPSRSGSRSRQICPKLEAERSCAACSATSPRTASSAIPRRSPTRASSRISSAAPRRRKPKNSRSVAVGDSSISNTLRSAIYSGLIGGLQTYGNRSFTHLLGDFAERWHQPQTQRRSG